jgi:CRP-like cAMP-binding protein
MSNFANANDLVRQAGLRGRERLLLSRIGGAEQDRVMPPITIFNKNPDAQSFEAGEIVFKEGDIGDAMYAVIEGSVDVIHRGQTFEAVGPGGILGEMALIDASPRSMTAVAAAPSRLVRVDKNHFTFLVHEHPTFSLQVMAIMAERLRRESDK